MWFHLEDLGFYSISFSGKNAFFSETFFEENKDIKLMKDL